MAANTKVGFGPFLSTILPIIGATRDGCVRSIGRIAREVGGGMSARASRARMTSGVNGRTAEVDSQVAGGSNCIELSAGQAEPGAHLGSIGAVWPPL